MALSEAQIAEYRRNGHLTVPGVFPAAAMDAAIVDIERWGEQFLADLPPAQRGWYIDGGVKARTVLRKLDDPAFFRPAIAALAKAPALVALVEALIGRGVAVCFSQVFFKPPEGGGPKPMHQDNFYFGPNDMGGMVTAWVALDDATVENGCMFFAEGSNRGPILPHEAPPGEPFNLQVPPQRAATIVMTPAPVPKGGVSFHHGHTLHQSGPNLSQRWRRAVALHYVRHDVHFATPALTYDASHRVPVS
jgi:phytanoyl-CoA hydroxylase